MWITRKHLNELIGRAVEHERRERIVEDRFDNVNKRISDNYIELDNLIFDLKARVDHLEQELGV